MKLDLRYFSHAYTDLHNCCVSRGGKDQKIKCVVVMMYEGSVDALKLKSNATLHMLWTVVIAIDIGVATISSTCEYNQELF